MKELSIKEKAKAYDEAIERANSLLSSNQLGNAWIYKLLPELKESEDERIVKELLTFFRESIHGGHILTNKEYDSWIAWLEKQGEQDMIPLDKVIKFLDDQLVNDKDEVTGQPFINFRNYGNFKETFISHFKRKMFEKQDEQKPNKVEPKFKVGDRIKYLKDSGMPFLIEKIENGEYIFGNNMGHTTIESGNTWYLVDTVEQKQVIDYSDSLSKDKWELVHEFVEKFGRIPKDEDELNVLVEYVLKRQKTAWSEEDDMMLNSILDSIQREGVLEKKRKTDWLKSLRPQSHWKPSEEQLKALKEAADEHFDIDGGALWHLYEDLKKLREK